MTEHRKSRRILSMFLRKNKKSSSSSNTPDPMPDNAAEISNEKRRNTPSSPFSLSGWQYTSHKSPETVYNASLSKSSLVTGAENQSIASSETVKKPRYEDYGGNTPRQSSYTPVSPRNFGPSPTYRLFSPTQGTTSPLLLLPAEIRNVIYEYVVGTPCIRLHTKVVAGDLTETGLLNSWETLSSNSNYRWAHAEPPRHTSSWLYHSGHRLRNVTRLWRICKQVYHESYTLSLSRMIFSFGNHLVAQDFLAHKHSDGIYPSSYVTFLLSITLREFENLPVDDLRQFIGLKKMAIQCPEKAAWEWVLWDEMSKERRDAEREKEKQAAREKVHERLQEAFPERSVEIQIGHPPIGRINEETLALEWDGGKTI